MTRADRATFSALIMLAVVGFWICPHLPLVDLPQHAAQIAGLRDVLRGDFAWGHLAEVNFLTPYLLGYIPGAVLALVMPVNSVISLLFSIALICFVLACRHLRATLGGDERLDVLFIPAFFSFAWHFGFFTFLISTPLAVFVIAQALRYARSPNRRSGISLALLVTLTFFCHALACLFACLMGGLLLLRRGRPFGQVILSGLPYVPVALLLLLFIFRNQDAAQGPASLVWAWTLTRLPLILPALTGLPMAKEPASAVLGLASTTLIFLMFLIPVLTSRLVIKGRGEVLLILGTTLFLWFVLPLRAVSTDFIYHRYNIFILPFYLLLFLPREKEPHKFLQLLPPLISLCFLTLHTVELQRFELESRGFNSLLEKMEPKQRALFIAFNNESSAVEKSMVYWYYGLWYQVEKQGWVEPNFAFFPVQIIRYQSGMVVERDEKFTWEPSFDWQKLHAWNYRYFILRVDESETEEQTARRFNGTPCLISPVTSHGPWRLYERGVCINQKPPA